MILPRPLIGALIRHEKQEHRVRVVSSEPRYRKSRKPRSGQSQTLVKPFNPHPGERIGLRSGKGEPIICHVIVTARRDALLGELSLKDARAEGHRTRAAYAEWWMKTHDRKWSEQDEGETVCEHGLTMDDEMLARFYRRHGHKPVWVLSLEVDEMAGDRYLAEGWPDYTTTQANAMKGEPPAVSESEQKLITEAAGTTYKQWRAIEVAQQRADRERMSLEQRIETAELVARRAHIDVSNEVYLLRTRIARGAGAEAVAKRLEALERKAFRDVAA